MTAEPTEWWAVDQIADRDGNPLPHPIRKGVFSTPEVAREYASKRHGPYPGSAFQVAQLWQERRPDGTLCQAFVPGDVR